MGSKRKKDKIIVNGIEFKSKKELKEYTKSKLESFDYNKEFFFDLIKRHPDYIKKVGIGIKDLKCIENPITGEKNHLVIVRIDDSKDDISWNKCVSQNNDTTYHNLIESMRSAIANDVIEYRNKSDKICVRCGATNDINVDHKDVPFDTIANRFI